MSLTSNDPLEVLRALRAVRGSVVVTEADFTSPSGDDVRAIEVPEPGLIHPEHLAWVARVLGRSEESLVHSLGELGEGEGPGAMALALSAATTPAWLSDLGVSAAELIVRRVPVSPGASRPNVSAVLSPLNAAYLDLLRWSDNVRRFTELGVPDIIIASRALTMKAAFERLLHLASGQGHLFTPQHQPNTDPPTPPELVVMPSRRTAGLMQSANTPLEVRLVGSTALLRFPVALACVDLSTGRFSVEPFAGANVVSVDADQAVFCDGARLSVFDLARRRFVTEPAHLPARVTLGACCGIEVLDTASRTTTMLPSPMASSGHDFAVSPCGRYAWLDLLPTADEVGVFSVQDLARVLSVWPHATLGTPAELEDQGEGHDVTPRALARQEDGSFRFVYGSHLLHGDHAHELPTGFTTAGFDPTGSRLALNDEQHLSVFSLGPIGQPTLEVRWSLAALGQHLTADTFDFTDTGTDAEALMAATGTIGALAGLTLEALSELLYFDEQPEALARLLTQARTVELPGALDRA